MNCQTTSLPQESLLHISGADSLTFLQGQVTCDTREVSPQQARPGAYCTPQGRVVCDFLLAQLGAEHFALRLRRDIRERAAGVFGKYIVFSKAALDATREDWQIQACWGPDARAALTAVFGGAPDARYAAVTGADFVLVQLDDAGEQFECYLRDRGAKPLLANLASHATGATGEDWAREQIRAGIGRIESATVEEFVPQMLNYDLTGHISFKKGCYTGQEVVARLHYRGTPKRRLYTGLSPVALVAGEPLYVPGTEQSIGNVVNCAAGAGGSYELLAVATRAALDGPLHTAGEVEVQLSAPPYPLEDGAD